MSAKKDKILSTALELFATDGFASTSTIKIAKKAGVSEGLIFRHFGSKQGLLEAIFDEMDARIQKLFLPIFESDNPRAVIRETLALPFSIPQREYDFWQLQFKLKWEVQRPNKMQPLQEKLTWAFRTLGESHPELRARLINQVLDASATELLRGEIEDPLAYRNFLLKEYAP